MPTSHKRSVTYPPPIIISRLSFDGSSWSNNVSAERQGAAEMHRVHHIRTSHEKHTTGWYLRANVRWKRLTPIWKFAEADRTGRKQLQMQDEWFCRTTPKKGEPSCLILIELVCKWVSCVTTEFCRGRFHFSAHKGRPMAQEGRSKIRKRVVIFPAPTFLCFVQFLNMNI